MPQTLIPCRLTDKSCLCDSHTVYEATDGMLICVWAPSVGGFRAQRGVEVPTVDADTVPRALAKLGYCLGARQLEFEFNA